MLHCKHTHACQNRFRHKDHQMEVSKYTKLPFKNGTEGWELRQIRYLCHIALFQLFLHTCGIRNANSLTFLCLCPFLLFPNPFFLHYDTLLQVYYEDVTSRVFAARPWPPAGALPANVLTNATAATLSGFQKHGSTKNNGESDVRETADTNHIH